MVKLQQNSKVERPSSALSRQSDINDNLNALNIRTINTADFYDFDSFLSSHQNHIQPISSSANNTRPNSAQIINNNYTNSSSLKQMQDLSRKNLETQQKLQLKQELKGQIDNDFAVNCFSLN